MMLTNGAKPTAWILLLSAVFLINGCFLNRAYRSANPKTIRDFSAKEKYRKHVGVMALTNTTIFKSFQVANPFMNEFLTGLELTAGDVILAIPGRVDVPSFLWDPPRLQTGELEVFKLSGFARQEGMNTVVTPILMDIRVRKVDTGFWFFRDISHRLQIQTAAALYDAATGTRLALKILTDEVEIDEFQASAVLSGQEPQVDELIDVAEEMGETLGKKMGKAIGKTLWKTSVQAIEGELCVIPAGSDAGVTPGDRFSVLEAGETIDGLNGQRFIVPGPKTGEIVIENVTPNKAYGSTASGGLPKVGSIVIGD